MLGAVFYIQQIIYRKIESKDPEHCLWVPDVKKPSSEVGGGAEKCLLHNCEDRSDDQNPSKKPASWGWGADSVGKSSCCFFRGPEFCSQPHSRWFTTVYNSNSKRPSVLFWPLKAPTCNSMHVHTCVHTHTCTILINKLIETGNKPVFSVLLLKIYSFPGVLGTHIYLHAHIHVHASSIWKKWSKNHFEYIQV